MRSSPSYSISKLTNANNVTKITDRIEALSLADDGGSSSSSSSSSSPQVFHRIQCMPKHRNLPRSVIGSHMTTVCNYMKYHHVPTRLKEIVNLTHTSLLLMPRGLLECLSTNKVFMGLAYRYKPGQTEFVKDDMLIPTSLDRLQLLREKLGLSVSKNRSSSIRDLCTFTHQDGIRSVIDANYSKNFIEVITLLNGTFCRILVLTTGIGCTVWYGFSPCIDGTVPPELFAPIVSYDPFFNVDHLAPNFHSAEINVNDNVSETIKDAFTSVPPLDEVKTPQEISGNVLRNVGLGIIIAVLITTGVLTITPDPVDIQQVMENI